MKNFTSWAWFINIFSHPHILKYLMCTGTILSCFSLIFFSFKISNSPWCSASICICAINTSRLGMNKKSAQLKRQEWKGTARRWWIVLVGSVNTLETKRVIVAPPFKVGYRYFTLSIFFLHLLSHIFDLISWDEL